MGKEPTLKDVKKLFHSEINRAKDHTSLAEILANCLQSVVAAKTLADPVTHNGYQYLPTSVERFVPASWAEKKDLSWMGENLKGCYASMTTFVIFSGGMSDPLHVKAFDNMLPDTIEAAVAMVTQSLEPVESTE